ncbi:MAG: site-specific DNA-methyltransferase [Actinomycetota bacterium]|nr:site-specific DNA-methyltransferase [Actinomycetota bacterium]
MTPYYDEDGIVIYHGDCREVIPRVDATTIALLLTDPPYGLNFVASSRAEPGKFEGEQVVGDDQLFDPRPLLRFGRCVIFGANYFAHFLPPGGWIIWSKVQDNRWSHGAMSTRSLAEVAWTNCHKYVGLYNYFWAGSPMYRLGEERGSQLHPTQKPVELMRYIVGRLTEPGDLVLDPYMGSGPVARACLDLERRYIGIEVEERYCEIAAKRLGQGVLAFGEPARPTPEVVA